jgi:hypothetical protein
MFVQASAATRSAARNRNHETHAFANHEPAIRDLVANVHAVLGIDATRESMEAVFSEWADDICTSYGKCNRSGIGLDAPRLGAMEWS